MNALFLKHVPFEGPAAAGKILERMGIGYRTCDVCDGGVLPDHGAYDLLFVMGGPMGAYDEAAFPWLAPELRWLEGAVAADKKIVGICLGAQLLARVLGAGVRKNPVSEIGWFPVTRLVHEPVTRFPEEFTPFHWHGDTFDIPSGAIRLARSEACENQAFLYGGGILGLQFHLEATREGIGDLIANCGADCSTGGPFVQEAGDMLKPRDMKGIHGLMKGIIASLAGPR